VHNGLEVNEYLVKANSHLAPRLGLGGLARIHTRERLLMREGQLNQSNPKSSQRHTRARRSRSSATSMGSKPRVAKRRRLGGLKVPTLAALVGT